MLNAGLVPPQFGRPPSVVINPWSYEACGPSLRTVAGALAVASAIYPVASLSIGVPFSVSEPTSWVSMFVLNGTVVSGNIDLGIYDDAGTLIVSKGSTAQAGTSAKQILDITDTTLYPGNRYYAFIACDNITATMFRQTPTQAALLAACGLVQVASNFPLAASVTFALITNVYIPVFGLSQLAVY